MNPELLNAIVVLILAVASFINRRKLNDIHVLVNGRYSDLVTEVKDLRSAYNSIQKPGDPPPPPPIVVPPDDPPAVPPVAP